MKQIIKRFWLTGSLVIAMIILSIGFFVVSTKSNRAIEDKTIIASFSSYAGNQATLTGWKTCDKFYLTSALGSDNKTHFFMGLPGEDKILWVILQ